MPNFAHRLRSIEYSGIRAMMEDAARLTDVIHLEVGDPNFATPPHIIEAAERAAAAGETHYTPSAGLPILRDLIVEKVRRRNGISCQRDNVVVTTGGAGGLFTTCLTLLDPGDEVLVPDPGWSGYPAIISTLGAVVRRYPLDPTREYIPDFTALDALIGPRTKAIIVNSPGNPLGTVDNAPTLDRIVNCAESRDIWVISDECYDEIVFERSHVSTATIRGMDRVITIFSFSKSYAMTGWRIGYVVAPPSLSTFIERMQEPVNACTSVISQKAAEAALRGPQDVVRQMCDAYRSRRDLAIRLLAETGVSCVRPLGGFYLMVDVSPAGGSVEFAQRLLREDHVAVTPGAAFGPAGNRFVRVSLASNIDDLSTGLRRLSNAIRRESALRAP